MSRGDLVLLLPTVVIVCSLLIFLGLRLLGPHERRLIKRIGRLSLGDKLALVRGFLSDRSIVLPIRLLPAVLVFYLAMPLDIVPDFIPVLGQLDDLLVPGLGLGLLLKLAPKGTLEQRVAALEKRVGD